MRDVIDKSLGFVDPAGGDGFRDDVDRQHRAHHGDDRMDAMVAAGAEARAMVTVAEVVELRP